MWLFSGATTSTDLYRQNTLHYSTPLERVVDFGRAGSGKRHQMQAGQCLRQSLVVIDESSKPAQPRTGALHTQHRGKSTTPCRAWTPSGHSLTTSNWRPHAFAACSAVSPLSPCSTQLTSTDSPVAAWTALASSQTCARSCALAGVTTKSRSSPTVSTAENLRALRCLFAAGGRALAALRRTLQRAAVEDTGRGVRSTALNKSDQHPQVGDGRCDPARLEPALRLLVGSSPGWEIVRQLPPAGTRPGSPRTYAPAQGVENLAQRLLPLRRVRCHQGQGGDDEGPFLVTDITRIGLASVCPFHGASRAHTESA